ncbi:Adhesion G-protein coupled receptor G4 [Pseudolycoriella hygida]|uniref:Adhesion G-protein coupled receptor G4 n=1 Tax=Pseudolycoriella hygida TaxID=35572 RepID=A0A9Q0N0X1_9DIPT|nr:Adhesion G-protein coupled receptor G4 [Pseudolycoriella hygida]
MALLSMQKIGQHLHTTCSKCHYTELDIKFIPITWPETIASNKQIPSDCLLDSKIQLARICDSRMSGWNPSIYATEILCVFYQPSYEEYGSCPPGYVASKDTEFCYQQIHSEKWEELCATTGGSSLSFLDLDSNDQFSIIQELMSSKSEAEKKLGIGLPAVNRYPSKQLRSDIDYKTEDVELQWLLPGRYGSILKFSNDSAKVVCSHKHLCIEMCLSINTTQTTLATPFTPVVDECANLNSVLCVTKKNRLLDSVGCTQPGYHRVRYSTLGTTCYSIKKFEQPLTIDDDRSTVVQSSCESNRILQIESIDTNTIFRQLASVFKLGKNDHCLFGVLWSNEIVMYSGWVEFTTSQLESIDFTNFDKSVDYSPILSRPDSFLTVNSEGKWRWEERTTCIVCAMDEDLPPSSVELLLQFDTSDPKLTLTVTDQNFFWKDHSSDFGFLCFALIGNDYTEVPVFSTSQEQLFSLPNVGRGKYWCSANLIPTISHIKSKDLYAFGMVFAFNVRFACEDSFEHFDHVEKFADALSSLIDDELMKIEDVRCVDTIGDKRILFHVMISLKRNSFDSEHNAVGLSEDELNTYYTLKYLRQLHDKVSAPYVILSVASREYCLPSSISAPEVLNWKAAKVNDSVVLLKGCFQFTRNCSRHGKEGADWDDYTFEMSCENQSEASKNLFSLHKYFRSAEQTHDVISNLSVTLNNVTAAINEDDVFIVSEILEKIASFLLSDQVELSYSDVSNVFVVINSLMSISRDVAMLSSQLNSTNSLLASFDDILIHQVQATSIQNDSFSDGVASLNTSFVAHYIFHPTVSNLSGIALLENKATEPKDFMSYSVKYLESNNSVDNLLKNENLVLASFVPQKLIETWNNSKIIFTLFFNDILFQSPTRQDFASDGSIISLTILNSDTNLSTSIPFIFKPNASLFRQSNTYMSAQLCGYWSFTSGSGWESTGCALNESFLWTSDRIVCACSHLTHFGNLINTLILFDEIHEKILNLITLSGCALSLIGILGIFVTAIVFRSWRSKSSSKFLLQLSAAIALQMVLILLTHIDDEILRIISQNIYGCIATGALLHYSVLAVFFWMLIVAYLQFLRYVIVFNQIATANFLLKSSVFGWGMPLLPVFIVVAVNPTSYIPSSNIKFCYPSGFSLLFGVFIPIILIVLANIFVFLAVVVSLTKGSSKSAACKVNDKNDAMWSQLRLSVFLFFVLGLSWIFGLLSDRSIIFSYLFCLTATLQGFVLFLYFVVLDPTARKLWRKFFKKIIGFKKY